MYDRHNLLLNLLLATNSTEAFKKKKKKGKERESTQYPLEGVVQCELPIDLCR